MERQRDGLVPIGEALAGMGGPVQTLRETPPPARRGFTLADQVNQLVGASEADPDLGFMARLLALCSLPRTNPGNRLRYVRCNGPYTLVMNAGGLHKLPFGNLPRLILAWVSTEVVRTGSREIILGKFRGPVRPKEEQMTERPKRDLEKEREELLRVLDSNAEKEVKEAIQIALSALPKPTPPTISYSTKGSG